jgi:hypothetical protein
LETLTTASSGAAASRSLAEVCSFGRVLLLSRVVVILQNMGSDFELLGELTTIEIIAVNLSIRER